MKTAILSGARTGTTTTAEALQPETGHVRLKPDLEIREKKPKAASTRPVLSEKTRHRLNACCEALGMEKQTVIETAVVSFLAFAETRPEQAKGFPGVLEIDNLECFAASRVRVSKEVASAAASLDWLPFNQLEELTAQSAGFMSLIGEAYSELKRKESGDSLERDWGIVSLGMDLGDRLVKAFKVVEEILTTARKAS